MDISKYTEIKKSFDKKLIEYQKFIDHNVVKEEHLDRLKTDTQSFITEIKTSLTDNNDEIIKILLQEGEGIPGTPTVWRMVPKPGEPHSDTISTEYLSNMIHQVTNWLNRFQEALTDDGNYKIDAERVESSLPLLRGLNNVSNLISSGYDKLVQKKDSRNILDDSRLALENTLKQIVKNERLENNVKNSSEKQSNLEQYLTEQNVSDILINSVQNFVSNIVIVNNRSIKHQRSDKEEKELSWEETRYIFFSTLEIIIFLNSFKAQT